MTFPVGHTYGKTMKRWFGETIESRRPGRYERWDEHVDGSTKRINPTAI